VADGLAHVVQAFNLLEEILLFDSALDRHLRGLQPSSAPKRRKPKDRPPMHLATVSRWNTKRGFGFLMSDIDIAGCPDRELFCHAKKLPKCMTALTPGQRVEFTPVAAHLPGRPPEARVTRILDELVQAA
jgi:cold shock CspA family protein